MGLCNFQFETTRKFYGECICHKFVAAVDGAIRYVAVFPSVCTQALAVPHTLRHTR